MTSIRRLRSGFALAMLVVVGCATPAMTSSGTRPSEVTSVFVRFPQNSVPGQPLRVLVALHGIGGDGESFARDLTAAADQNGWVLVAPTIAYGDWMDPVQVAHEDAALINWLSDYLSQVPNQTDRPIDSGILLLGFSRGAQLAHRFAETYPERTVAVAVVSAGSYTLPQATAADGTPLPFSPITPPQPPDLVITHLNFMLGSHTVCCAYPGCRRRTQIGRCPEARPGRTWLRGRRRL